MGCGLSLFFWICRQIDLARVDLDFFVGFQANGVVDFDFFLDLQAGILDLFRVDLDIFCRISAKWGCGLNLFFWICRQIDLARVDLDFFVGFQAKWACGLRLFCGLRAGILDLSRVDLDFFVGFQANGAVDLVFFKDNFFWIEGRQIRLVSCGLSLFFFSGILDLFRVDLDFFAGFQPNGVVDLVFFLDL